jgi:hypothetical protein
VEFAYGAIDWSAIVAVVAVVAAVLTYAYWPSAANCMAQLYVFRYPKKDASNADSSRTHRQHCWRPSPLSNHPNSRHLR